MAAADAFGAKMSDVEQDYLNKCTVSYLLV